MQPEEEDKKIVQLNESMVTLGEDGRVLDIHHRYYKTTCRFPTPPYCHIPFYLKGYNSKSKKFTIVVLTDKRELDYVPVGTSCVPISEEEAQELVDHRARFKKPSSPGNPKPLITVEEDEKIETSERRPTGRQKNKTSIRQIVMQGYSDRKSKDEIVERVLSFYPDKLKTDVRKLVDFYWYDAKKVIKL